VKWGIAFLMLGVLAFSGCRNEKGGVSTSEYEANKPKILAAARKGVAGNAPKGVAGKQPEAQPEQKAQARMGTGYTYDPTDKRDPFRSFILDQAKEAADREVGPLEQFDISQLSVVAVVWDTGLPIALVADPSGRPYVVNEGTAVGKNDGRVIKIDDGLVLVKETYVDWLGDKTTKDIEMRLAGGDKGGDLR
jgi:Tfp pilus assembly protein PilP